MQELVITAVALVIFVTGLVLGISVGPKKYEEKAIKKGVVKYQCDEKSGFTTAVWVSDGTPVFGPEAKKE